MLKLDVRAVMEDRGIEKPNQFLINNGLTFRAASKLLNDPNERFSFKELEKLCLALNCSPDEIIVWKPSRE